MLATPLLSSPRAFQFHRLHHRICSNSSTFALISGTGPRPSRPSALSRAKFEKFGSDNAPLPLETAAREEPDPERPQELEEDSDLPSDLEGAIRQSSQASAAFFASGGMRAIVELLIPQLQFLDSEGAQLELWELSRIFLESLMEHAGIQKVKAIFPDAGAAALLKYQWQDANFGFASLSDRKPIEVDDEVVVMVVPDYQMLDYVECIASHLSDNPYFHYHLLHETLAIWCNLQMLPGDVESVL
ncbi:hypothetical protein AXF42_Ash005251 [Apostasia shenzhenica]|uniref:DUF1995 domain-containing protein n=1 Tax=Apostasia shenzhenica TaxID=1088818 RepID=A0A2I0B6D4_9ASPA|nr:hypothetical protein AXF42_Ash005251 [Apostasia shenzhenica]